MQFEHARDIGVRPGRILEVTRLDDVSVAGEG
jgi:hypothetical protein